MRAWPELTCLPRGLTLPLHSGLLFPHHILPMNNTSCKLFDFCVLRDSLLERAAHYIPAVSFFPAVSFTPCLLWVDLAATVTCLLPVCPARLVHNACRSCKAFVPPKSGLFCLFLVYFVTLTVIAPLMLLFDPLSRPEEPPTWSGYMGKMFQAATNYLPAQVSGMMSQDRAFATVRLNISGQRNICALSTCVLTPVSPLPHQPVGRQHYLCRTPPEWLLILCPWSMQHAVCCSCVWVQMCWDSSCFSH